jgi:medium-chain acyl-[acyl-carrier-protein] hydrolase
MEAISLEPIYQTSFLLRASDADFMGTWRPAAAFTAMQELGEMHSAKLGVGFFDLRPLSAAWVVTRTLLEIDRLPVIGEKITARTWPGRARHAVYPRYYTFDDEAGRPLARASSLWVLMDMGAREMITAKSRGLPDFAAATLAPPIANPGGIARLTGAPDVQRRQVVFSDLDINRHVNNAKYVEWLCDRFDHSWHLSNRMARLLVHFSGETRPEDALKTALTVDGPAFTFEGTREGQALFSMGGTFAPR